MLLVNNALELGFEPRSHYRHGFLLKFETVAMPLCDSSKLYKPKIYSKFMEPILHILIPLLILLALFPKLDKRLVIGLSLVAILPDLDFFIPSLHRIFTHNLFSTTIVSLVIYLISSNLKVFYISLYYLTSHLILDLAIGGVALFYPLYKKLIELTITLNTDFNLIINIKTHELAKVMEYTGPHYLFTKTSILILFIILVMLLVKYRKKLFKCKGVPFLVDR